MSWRILFKGFILTKWYVNSRLVPKFFTPAPGFILTKWYVNIFKNVGDTLKSIGFILTKWYVNFESCNIID
ncbi:Uncharacterised protein [Clostridioides difficile]|nr:Uncharacterised protein [Clostridioides difficile]